MRPNFQPNIHLKFRERIDGRRKKHRLPYPATPMNRRATFPRTSRSRHRAEKWNAVRLRHEIRQRRLQLQ